MLDGASDQVSSDIESNRNQTYNAEFVPSFNVYSALKATLFQIAAQQY
jgi:hypothetical protein